MRDGDERQVRVDRVAVPGMAGHGTTNRQGTIGYGTNGQGTNGHDTSGQDTNLRGVRGGPGADGHDTNLRGVRRGSGADGSGADGPGTGNPDAAGPDAGGPDAAEPGADRSDASVSGTDRSARGGFGADAIRAIADGARLTLSPRLLAEVAANREQVRAALTDPNRPVYGVTTGMGAFAGRRLDPDEQASHQLRLLTARAVGEPPWLPVADVRALLAIVLRTALRPETGASAELCRFLADRLNDGFHPAVPREGIGCAGEIIPLCHAGQALAGIGTVLAERDPAAPGGDPAAAAGLADPSGDRVEVPAAEALAARGVEPYRPGPKEGVILLEGIPVATMHGIRRGAEAATATERLLVAAAATIDALGAPRAGYDPRLAAGDPVLADRYARLRALTDGGTVRAGVLHAPVSFRVVPQVLAHLSRTVADLAGAVDRALGWVTDSPAFLAGEFVSTAGYHACELGLRLDAVTAALTHAAESSVQRMARLLDERYSGLPPQLAAVPGPQAGLVTVHKRAVGELQALRRLAAPATLGSLDTSAGQEDLQAFAPAAGEQLRAALDRVESITAAELLTAYQAWTVRGAAIAPALVPLRAAIGELVPPVYQDRPLGVDLRRLRTALRSGALDVASA
ncbi:histidine ammonia-lyase [Actinocatenispora thailandica]|uniref:Histidine ammonia-lyase n=1 Tax=Actinocatenispora thailandica TaxID=227318 RepID=A0A7R7HWR1_9ACTN|nr:aromatic amino acid ammonia-lyase [Actinocatenispora thailandica]BCJ34249.1 histidine ammonia-lyase [Actinocatenispora thailandica]